MPNSMIKAYAQLGQATDWIDHYRHKKPIFVGALGFTETALIPGISAAGKTPEDRSRTAHADAEFLANGVCDRVTYPLPPLIAGASPVMISRAIIQALSIPSYLFNTGLPAPLSSSIASDIFTSDVFTSDVFENKTVLPNTVARCVSTGQAMAFQRVEYLLACGMRIGAKLASTQSRLQCYFILGECVVGGTTTALATLLGLGIDAAGRVSSSHSACNHDQKLQVVQAGLAKFWASGFNPTDPDFPLRLLAAVGDPMQPFAAGFVIGASPVCGVLLAGGTQMLAVYALARSIALAQDLFWKPENVLVGTTRWVAEDPTGDTVGLAEKIGDVPLIATQLNFTTSHLEALRAYEHGFVKEGVGAGGCAIAGALYKNWDNDRMVHEIETLCLRLQASLQADRRDKSWSSSAAIRL